MRIKWKIRLRVYFLPIFLPQSRIAFPGFQRYCFSIISFIPQHRVSVFCVFSILSVQLVTRQNSVLSRDLYMYLSVKIKLSNICEIAHPVPGIQKVVSKYLQLLLLTANIFLPPRLFISMLCLKLFLLPPNLQRKFSHVLSNFCPNSRFIARSCLT